MRVVARGCGPTIAADGTLAYTGGVEISRFGTYVTTDVRIANWAGSRRLRAYHDRLITGLAFTGSSRLLIATTAGVAGGAVDAIARDGRGRRIAVIGRGSLSAWPAPRGELVLVARNLPDGSGSVRLAEASSGATRWLLPTTGPAQVAWSPDARTLLLADRVSWRVVAVATGTVKRRLAPLGREPSWCCPDPPADPVIRLHVAGWHTGVAHS
jgi:hypothetical protein